MCYIQDEIQIVDPKTFVKCVHVHIEGSAHYEGSDGERPEGQGVIGIP